MRFVADARPAEHTDLTTDAPGVMCPSCRVTVPNGGAWVTWCDACDWNVSGGRQPEPKKGLRRVQARIVTRAAERLHAEMVGHGSAGTGRVPMGAAFGAAVVISIVVLTGVVALAACVIWAAAVAHAWWHWPLAVFCGLLLAALLPRPNPLRDDVLELTREEAPHTWRLVDEVSDRLGLRPPAVLGFDPRFNAAVTRIGWRHRSTLIIGAPCWTLLDMQEKVALLGHELGHVRHGDTAWRVPVSAASTVLGRLQGLLQPDPVWSARRGLGLFGPAVNALKWVLRMPVTGLLVLLSVATARYGQRKEYHADLAAAGMAGPAAASSLLVRLLGLEGTTVRVAAAVRRGEGPWHTLGTSARIPARERERLMRLGVRDGHRVDDTHPPTHLRLDLVSSVKPVVAPFSADHLAVGVERELAAVQVRLTRRVEDELRDA